MLTIFGKSLSLMLERALNTPLQVMLWYEQKGEKIENMIF